MIYHYPAWKYALLLFVVLVSSIYAWPNYYPDDPSIQIGTHKAGGKVSQRVLDQAVEKLQEANIEVKATELHENAALIRLVSNEAQLHAKDIVVSSISSDIYVVALNLAPTTPQWLRNINAWPMKLGLDLRGGVHFLLQVEMDQIIENRLKVMRDGIETQVIGAIPKEMRHQSIRLEGKDKLIMEFASEEARDKVLPLIRTKFPELKILEKEAGLQFFLDLSLTEQAITGIQNYAIDQNRSAISNRINELGVAEPLVQRQGSDRIVVELPGIQDTAEAKRIIGKTASLQFRLVDEKADTSAFLGRVPRGSEIFPFKGQNRQVVVKKRIIVSGDNVIDAKAGFDENSNPQVSISLDGQGAAKMHLISSKNILKRMAVLFIETKRQPIQVKDENGNMVLQEQTVKTTEVINVATIQSALGNNFRITGLDSPAEANELALFLRSGALAANMYFIEERTIGPSLGKENIMAGIKSVVVGFVLVLLIMVFYYKGFGMIANVALLANLIIMLAVMSALQATLTLPGIAGIVLTVGMAVDANVLIFARIKEELAKGLSSAEAISEGYNRAFETILDANITTFLVAVVLFAAGSGTVKGFAVTLCIGIVTSMFTSIMGTRALVTLIHGNSRIGTLNI